MATATSSARLHANGANAKPTKQARVVAAYIRKLQRHHHHAPCFMSEARFSCMEFDCRWRAECMRLVADFRR